MTEKEQKFNDHLMMVYNTLSNHLESEDKETSFSYDKMTEQELQVLKELVETAKTGIVDNNILDIGLKEASYAVFLENAISEAPKTKDGITLVVAPNMEYFATIDELKKKELQKAMDKCIKLKEKLANCTSVDEIIQTFKSSNVINKCLIVDRSDNVKIHIADLKDNALNVVSTYRVLDKVFNRLKGPYKYFCTEPAK